MTACVTAPTAPQTSLYERLGGRTAIAAVVDQALKNAVADPQISDYFIGTHIDAVAASITDQLCQATGGPCIYQGRTMLAAHAGMGINEQDFNAFMDSLGQALTTFKVVASDQQELLTLLRPMQDTMVKKRQQRSSYY